MKENEEEGLEAGAGEFMVAAGAGDAAGLEPMKPKAEAEGTGASACAPEEMKPNAEDVESFWSAVVREASAAPAASKLEIDGGT